MGIILTNEEGRLFWARRVGQDAWQFPQGGIRSSETPTQALYRELREEVGLQSQDVHVMGSTRNWLCYRLPKRLVRSNSSPVCIGQKQVWYMLRLVSDEKRVRLDLSDKPEFDRWRWIDYWRPIDEVIYFKRNVYRRALREFQHLVSHAITNAHTAKSSPAA